MTGPATPGHRGQEAALRSAELLGFGGPQAWLLGMAGLPEGLAGLGHALGSTPESSFPWFPVFEMYFLGCTLSSLAAFGKLFFFLLFIDNWDGRSWKALLSQKFTIKKSEVALN